jgi:hypothetical protein
MEPVVWARERAAENVRSAVEIAKARRRTGLLKIDLARMLAHACAAVVVCSVAVRSLRTLSIGSV